MARAVKIGFATALAAGLLNRDIWRPLLLFIIALVVAYIVPSLFDDNTTSEYRRSGYQATQSSQLKSRDKF